MIGGAIYRSNDKGETWEKMGEIHDFFKPFSGTYGWVFSQIRVDPKNENEVYAMGVSMGKSEDGGKTWKQFRPTDKKANGYMVIIMQCGLMQQILTALSSAMMVV